MKCPFCGYTESRVIDSRPAEEGASIRRRRECLACQRRFTTYEVMERLPLVVIKRDGSRQTFDKNKLIGSMLKACEKRSVALGDLEKIADEIPESRSGRLRPLRLGLPPVQGYQHLHGRADPPDGEREITERTAPAAAAGGPVTFAKAPRGNHFSRRRFYSVQPLYLSPADDILFTTMRKTSFQEAS